MLADVQEERVVGARSRASAICVSDLHFPSPRFLTRLFFSCPLSVPRRAEPASEEREGDPGQPDGPHAGLLQEELRQPLSRQSGRRRTNACNVRLHIVTFEVCH